MLNKRLLTITLISAVIVSSCSTEQRNIPIYRNKENIKTFYEWCTSTDNSKDLDRTIEALLSAVQMNDLRNTAQVTKSSPGTDRSPDLEYTKALSIARNNNCKEADRKLTQLTNLDLYYEKIKDLRPLSSLINLTTLDLIGNEINDIAPLSNLDKLNYLALAKNNISDITPLKNLKNLSYLSLNQNKLSDIDSLSALKKLNNVTLSDNTLLKNKCPLENYICHF